MQRTEEIWVVGPPSAHGSAERCAFIGHPCSQHVLLHIHIEFPSSLWHVHARARTHKEASLRLCVPGRSPSRPSIVRPDGLYGTEACQRYQLPPLEATYSHHATTPLRMYLLHDAAICYEGSPSSEATSPVRSRSLAAMIAKSSECGGRHCVYEPLFTLFYFQHVDVLPSTPGSFWTFSNTLVSLHYVWVPSQRTSFHAASCIRMHGSLPF
ncbi:hypothetical protein BDN71DRAFT_1304221 [Pleurotus eryngii]|uniref:Uncharacterized protein n=1 Tax=Pleurotus eryngii TaxID=5323 RepID=A0A9P5ZQY4_PLEER|nr:hypothetical protein BDN71DRAFT_1304221 [Pleurotus eryngii]